MAGITKYNAKDCVVTVDSVYITGLGEDMVTGEKDEDNVSAVVGAQGDVVVNETNDTLGTVKLTVQGTSPQLAFLKKLARTKAMFPIWVTNKALKEKFGGTKAMVRKSAAVGYGKELEDREFDIMVFDYTEE